MTEDPSPEFSRPIDLAGLGGASRSLQLQARPAERATLAARLGLQSIGRLTADVTLTREGTEIVALAGTLEAEVTQTCVVSNEDFVQQISAEVDRRYLLGRAARQSEVDIDPEAEDPPEPLPSGELDLGEVIAEELSLALDPYPRKPGLETLSVSIGDEGGETQDKKNPFAALAALRDKKSS